MAICEKCGTEKVPSCPICGKPVEVWDRVVGYFRPVSNWNDGKQEERRNRVPFDTDFIRRKIDEHQKKE